MGANIMDYIALAKAGYKKADIDKIIALSEQETAKPEEQPGATDSNIEQPASPEAEKPAEKEVEADAPVKEEIDYKELYEKSQEDLKKAQALNRSGDNSGKNNVDSEKDLMELIGSYM